jgi:hypothetical protein
MPDSSIERIIEYCTGIASEFEARLNRIRTFVPDHNLTSGTANEEILRNFLAGHVAARFKVGQGFICDPTNSNSVSKQCDILVYDHHSYPNVYVDGNVEVVFPDSVRMLIEVKTNLTKEKLYQALENIEAGRRLNYRMSGVIFAFESPSLEKLIANLREYPRQIDSHHVPIAILSLNEGIVIHRWPGTELGGTRSAYEVRVSKKEKGNLVIAFLLLLFFDAQMLGVVGGAAIENLIRNMLADRMEAVLDNLAIGSTQPPSAA